MPWINTKLHNTVYFVTEYYFAAVKMAFKRRLYPKLNYAIIQVNFRHDKFLGVDEYHTTEKIISICKHGVFIVYHSRNILVWFLHYLRLNIAIFLKTVFEKVDYDKKRYSLWC